MARFAAGADHAGFRLKDTLVGILRAAGHEVDDLGTNSPDSVDYPDFGSAVGRAVAAGDANFGLCVCGSGVGISIAANKVAGIRAVNVHDVTGARLARQHGDANVVCFGERLVGVDVAKDALLAFVTTAFDGGRHALRVEKLALLDGSRPCAAT